MPLSKRRSLDSFGDKEDREFALKVKQFQWERLKTLISALGFGATVIAAIGLFITYRQGEERMLTERFAQAVEQLGHQDTSVRVAGIYALERIAKESYIDNWTVFEVLTSYVREKSPSSNQAKPPVDIQSAITVVVRRNPSNDVKGNFLDLSSSNLRSNRFSNSIFSRANFGGSDLRDADLSETDFSFADFTSANLLGAKLSGADFSGANLSGANLRDTKLSGGMKSEGEFDYELTVFKTAIFSHANFMNTDLRGADLTGIDLSQARSLTKSQLELAKLCRTELPEGINLKPDRDCKEVELKLKSP